MEGCGSGLNVVRLAYWGCMIMGLGLGLWRGEVVMEGMIQSYSAPIYVISH